MVGPFKINGVPLRRINQRYVIATSTRLDISKLKLSETFNDTYFRRDKSSVKLAREGQEGDIFSAPKSAYAVTDTRKKDQVNISINYLSLHITLDTSGQCKGFIHLVSSLIIVLKSLHSIFNCSC